MSRIPSTTTEGRSSSRCECQLAFDAPVFARFYERFAEPVFIQWVVSFEKAFVNLMELSLSVSNLPCYESIESP